MTTCGNEQQHTHGHGHGHGHKHGQGQGQNQCGCGEHHSFASPEEEKKQLEKYKEALKKELVKVDARLEEL